MHREYAGSVAICEDACGNYADGACGYYSYNSRTLECFMFGSCLTLDDAICPECVSGSLGCELEDEGHFDFIMVAGGDGAYDSVEVVSVDPASNPVPDCLTELSPLPIQVLGHAGYLDHSKGGVPFFCGGYIPGDGPTDLCHKYVAESDEWEVSGTLSQRMAYTGHGSSESWGLVMTGDGDYPKAVERTRDGETFGFLPPHSTDYASESCMAVIDDDRIALFGGGPSADTINLGCNSIDTLNFGRKTGLQTGPHFGPNSLQV